MNDLPRQKLRDLISQYGRSLCDDPIEVIAPKLTKRLFIMIM